MRIIFLHGVDAQTTNYSDRLYRRVIAACRAALTAAGRGQDDIDTTLRRLVHHEIFWAELTTDRTNRYLDLAYAQPNFFWNALTRPVDPLGLQIMQYIKDKGDKHTGPMNILASVDADFRRLFATTDVGEDPTRTQQHAIIVAHSLGSVIAFDYVMGFRPKHELQRGVTVDSFITMGSPLPIFTSAMGHPDSDLTLPGHVKNWVNIRSPRDVFARPIKPFFRNIPIDEHLVRTHFLPVPAHTGYWTNDATANIIAREVLIALAAEPPLAHSHPSHMTTSAI
jgi:hypothetical protein